MAMAPRSCAVTLTLFAVGLCAVSLHVNCAFAQYQPTCRSMDDMIDRSTLLSCTRNDLCDTANCNINNRWLDHYSLKLTLLSCRNPPAVHMVLGNSDSTVFEADVDHTINDIDISGVGDVDITLNQLQDQNAIGFGITLTVRLGFFSTSFNVVPYSVLQLDTPSCTPPPTEPPIATEGNTTENITTDSPTTAGYGPTCDGFDNLVNNVNHMVCTRNEDCDTANCDITQSPFDDYTLSMTLLSCREPQPGVRVVARDGSGQEVLNTTVDESQSGIELSSEANLDITLNQMKDSIGIAADVDVTLGITTIPLTLITYTLLPLDRRSCPTQDDTTTTTSSTATPSTATPSTAGTTTENITTTTGSTATPTTEGTTTENITTTSSTATPTTAGTTTENITTTSSTATPTTAGTTTENITTTSSTATPTTAGTTTENITTTSSTATPTTKDTTTTDSVTTDGPTIVDSTEGEGPYGPTCVGFDHLVNNVSHMVCIRNEDCDTANCNITQFPFDKYTLSMTLLSCREPRPGVRVVARDGSGQEVLNTTVDESQSAIELSSEATLDITLDQMKDSIGIAADVTVFTSTTLSLLSYTILPLDRRSCPTQASPTTEDTTTTASSEPPTTENTTTTSELPTTEDNTTSTSELPTTPATTSELPTAEETTRKPNLPGLSNLPLLCPSTPVTPPRSPTARTETEDD